MSGLHCFPPAKAERINGLEDDLTVHQQLELFGLHDLRHHHHDDPRMLRRLEAASAVLAEDFSDLESIAYSASAFCMTGFPHSRPADNAAPWHRKNGAVHLIVEPGTIIVNDAPVHVGVPFGAKARLILLYVQSHVQQDGTVPLGKSLTGWMKRLGFSVSGGSTGSIGQFKEQLLRLSRARVSIHWTVNGRTSAMVDQTPVDGLLLWANGDPGNQWLEALHMSPGFLSHLEKHRVPLADRAIQHLRASSLSLDLYCWLAHRLHPDRLKKPITLRWSVIAGQLGSDYACTRQMAARVKSVLPDVLAVYPGARVEGARSGLTLWPSHPPVPKE